MVICGLSFIVLILIETEIVKGNKMRYMKHTVAHCEKAYIRGDTMCTYSNLYLFNGRDFLYMNELWGHPEERLRPDDANEARIYWKPIKL